ncbi:hypothetical protein COLU111180_12740 [Cohnella lubricantis]|uniref:WYL domain-containing protein n=1 Tax=Cohnella lubricantis TaxID=2163172 RepID=A0A841TEM8_9BACL|nr:hypothetical protein [Cohnella lubricantis]MBB6677437.1 hypothetical protein [Cohnella lubricantis]MBP2117515.1 putative DNA-binding transcriptional regulator YafY [Cohnella lubricantis]
MRFEQLVGRRADVIYEDSKGIITQRTVTVYSVRDGQMKVFDLMKQAYRTLKLERVLAAQPVLGRRVS